MTDQQKQAVEKAADDLYLEYDYPMEWLFKMGEHIITNPSDFGLVSKEIMFEFIRWVHVNRVYDPNTDLKEFWWEDRAGKEYNTAQLFEIYKKSKV